MPASEIRQARRSLPLLARLRHANRAGECPVIGVERKCPVDCRNDAIDPKRTLASLYPSPTIMVKAEVRQSLIMPRCPQEGGSRGAGRSAYTYVPVFKSVHLSRKAISQGTRAAVRCLHLGPEDLILRGRLAAPGLAGKLTSPYRFLGHRRSRFAGDLNCLDTTQTEAQY
jgi:hypothetical protein